MSTMVKELNSTDLRKVQALEKKLDMGSTAVAYEMKAMPAKLNDAQLKEVQMTEKDTGSTIVVFEKM